ncbi:MAG: PepSY domain-containing protein [Acidobacteria bacterium]|nr:PepSY domain-containing protein [Acidobacteriota bacterium]
MKIRKTQILFLVFGLILGFAILSTANDVSAQETKPKAEKKQKQSNDDEENEPTAQEQKKLAKQAKIKKPAAQEIAIKRVPGEIIESEIEKENGKLIWSFDIRGKDGKIYDVEIDANSGKVLNVEEDDEENAEQKDDDTEISVSQNNNFFRKTGKGISSITSKVFRKITGN